MKWLLLMTAAFLLLLLFPILMGVYWYFRNKKSVLVISHDYRKDPRYFAYAFDQKFQKAWAARTEDTLELSKTEKYQMAENLQPKDYENGIQTILAAEEDYTSPEKTEFYKEIYAWKNCRISDDSALRVVCVKKKLVLGNRVQLSRWADAADTVAVYDDCELGKSVSSRTALSIGKNNRFFRVFAPIIHFGAYPGDNEVPEYERPAEIYELPMPEERIRMSGHISREDTNEAGIAAASYITSGKITVEEGIIVQGSIRAHGGILLSERSVVCGNLFSDGDIYLSKDATVLGNVFTQGNIIFEEGVVVGQKENIRSVIARDDITIGRDCFVYGYVEATGMGSVWLTDETDEKREENYLELTEDVGHHVLYRGIGFGGHNKMTDAKEAKMGE